MNSKKEREERAAFIAGYIKGYFEAEQGMEQRYDETDMYNASQDISVQEKPLQDRKEWLKEQSDMWEEEK